VQADPAGSSDCYVHPAAAATALNSGRMYITPEASAKTAMSARNRSSRGSAPGSTRSWGHACSCRRPRILRRRQPRHADAVSIHVAQDAHSAELNEWAAEDPDHREGERCRSCATLHRPADRRYYTPAYNHSRAAARYGSSRNDRRHAL